MKPDNVWVMHENTVTLKNHCMKNVFIPTTAVTHFSLRHNMTFVSINCALLKLYFTRFNNHEQVMCATLYIYFNKYNKEKNKRIIEMHPIDRLLLNPFCQTLLNKNYLCWSTEIIIEMKPQVTGAKLAMGWPNENASHVRDEICMSHPKLSFPHLTSLKMYRSIWKAFF
jgi:hypothetical protein